MAERLLILLILALFGVALWGSVRLWQRVKLRRLQEDALPVGLVPAGKPAVVAFSTANCVECRTRQAPALERLREMIGDGVEVRSLSALEHPELVSQIGILTVPATVVVDGRGMIRHLNLGYASERKLQAQLRTL